MTVKTAIGELKEINQVLNAAKSRKSHKTTVKVAASELIFGE
ncbi:hypothetical protein GAGA_0504 [Paraglaciecola agarilytica NO2]|uniref:Uncharacterized protein n=1 Tax=Paraglaciecola agarilytica NO2 TaxID=1125747 RepID=A0ABQ0I236_9ALTE|nr:hypothetical protein GAGA_0504 [Paraglaciecola agarilytica NO2]|tara:strand:- start:6813 stop:6938 length:126 start_codon:yes stop_codon:yes gene_type:complete